MPVDERTVCRQTRPLCRERRSEVGGVVPASRGWTALSCALLPWLAGRDPGSHQLLSPHGVSAWGSVQTPVPPPSQGRTRSYWRDGCVLNVSAFLFRPVEQERKSKARVPTLTPLGCAPVGCQASGPQQTRGWRERSPPDAPRCAGHIWRSLQRAGGQAALPLWMGMLWTGRLATWTGAPAGPVWAARLCNRSLPLPRGCSRANTPMGQAGAPPQGALPAEGRAGKTGTAVRSTVHVAAIAAVTRGVLLTGQDASPRLLTWHLF